MDSQCLSRLAALRSDLLPVPRPFDLSGSRLLVVGAGGSELSAVAGLLSNESMHAGHQSLRPGDLATVGWPYASRCAPSITECGWHFAPKDGQHPSPQQDHYGIIFKVHREPLAAMSALAEGFLAEGSCSSASSNLVNTFAWQFAAERLAASFGGGIGGRVLNASLAPSRRCQSWCLSKPFQSGKTMKDRCRNRSCRGCDTCATLFEATPPPPPPSACQLWCMTKPFPPGRGFQHRCRNSACNACGACPKEEPVSPWSAPPEAEDAVAPGRVRPFEGDTPVVCSWPREERLLLALHYWVEWNLLSDAHADLAFQARPPCRMRPVRACPSATRPRRACGRSSGSTRPRSRPRGAASASSAPAAVAPLPCALRHSAPTGRTA